MDYQETIESLVFNGIKICEIGPSGQPTIKSSIIKERGLDYTIIDIETSHWNEYNPEVKKYNIDLQKDFDSSLDNKFDLVISQMVLEHIEYPESFHKAIYRLLNKSGSAVHLYANPFSVSAVMNRLLPEMVGEFILKLINNRDLNKNHKYPAYYRWCFTPSKKARVRLQSLGYSLEKHIGYPGHNYLQSVPVLNLLEKLYSKILSFLRLNLLSTLSLLHVKK